MALLGAEILLYPTAIGSEPETRTSIEPGPLAAGDAGPCRRQHDAAVAVEPHRARGRRSLRDRRFYGSSFIADNTGAKVAEANETDAGVLTASFDLDAMQQARAAWGLFRDRRPDLYGALLSLDGQR